MLSLLFFAILPADSKWWPRGQLEKEPNGKGLEGGQHVESAGKYGIKTLP